MLIHIAVYMAIDNYSQRFLSLNTKNCQLLYFTLMVNSNWGLDMFPA